MAKVSNTQVIVSELLVGGDSIEAIRDKVVAKIPGAKGSKIVSQIKGVLSNIKRGAIKRWQAYVLVDGKIAIKKKE